MAKQLTADDARQSLTAHVEGKGVEVYLKYGPQIGWEQLQRLLEDRTCVRYPCEIRFDAEALLPGEFAHPAPKGERPEDGFVMNVHPAFAARLEDAVPLVLYQLVAVNYGEFAAAEDAETFGAACLGLTCDEYYERICALADEIFGVPAEPDPVAHSCSCGGGGCGG
jgi:hypothetical protein